MIPKYMNEIFTQFVYIFQATHEFKVVFLSYDMFNNFIFSKF